MIETDTTPIHVTGDALDTIWWRGKQWAVTEYGVEALNGTYSIAASRLTEDMKESGWPSHMAAKEWVNLPDFLTAWLVGLALHGHKTAGAHKAILQASKQRAA
jgi:hypothetical protein